MGSVRGRLLVSMLACASITLVGSLIAWRGLARLEGQIVAITQGTWPTADACMELWIAALTKERARLRLRSPEAADQFEWARSFARHALRELEQGGEMEPRLIAELARLDRELDRRIADYLTATSPVQREQLDREIEASMLRLEEAIAPEEHKWDVAMDDAGFTSLDTVRRWQVSLAVITLAALGAAGGLALWLSRRFVAPLNRLADFTHRLGAGESPPALGDHTQDEIGALARSFDKMATKLAASRQQLVASEQRYRTLFEHARHGIAVLGSEREILEANPALAQLCKVERTSLPGMDFFELLASGKPEELDDALEKVLSETHSAVDLEIKTDGDPATVEVSGVRVPDGRTVLVLRDTREQQRIEQALIQGEKLSAVGQLAAGVAHELRNPLFVISNVIYDLRDTLGAQGECRQALDIAVQENDRARKIIDNLLEFSRQSPPDVHIIDPVALIRQAALLFQKALHEHGIELRLELDSTTLCAFDPDGFKQVIVNLISNAIDAMPGGGTLTLHTETRADGRVAVSVSDTGEGIPEAQRKQIFNPFYSTKMPGAGAGLGLWIVHSTVSRFGGRIEVESRVGRGTTFLIDLTGAEYSA